MQWYRVAIHTNEPSAANESATSLIKGVGTAYRAAGAPDGVQVYHRRSAHRPSLLSPAVASL